MAGSRLDVAEPPVRALKRGVDAAVDDAFTTFDETAAALNERVSRPANFSGASRIGSGEQFVPG
jgi:hypothetical protein